MKRRIPAGLALAAALSFLQPATAQQSVPQETMKKVYETAIIGLTQDASYAMIPKGIRE